MLQVKAMASPLNYDEMILLDAEDLAETGLKEAYDALLPQLRRYTPNPVSIVEHIDSDRPRYAISAGGSEYVIYEELTHETEADSWARATWALFTIVNKQLLNSGIRFYAINGGNDLGGMFLTEKQVKDAVRSLPRKTDWPYIPTDQRPWYGQQH